MSNQPKTKIPLEVLENDLARLEADDNSFPIEVFPEELQTIIREYSRITGAPACFLGGAMLVVAGVALGNSKRLYYGGYFGKKIPPISAKGYHPFRKKVTTRFGERLPPVSEKGYHLFRKKVTTLTCHILIFNWN